MYDSFTLVHSLLLFIPRITSPIKQLRKTLIQKTKKMLPISISRNLKMVELPMYNIGGIYDKIPHDKIPHDKIPRDKIPHDKIPHDRIPHDKIPRAGPNIRQTRKCVRYYIRLCALL